MKYIITKEVEAEDIEEAIKKEKKEKISSIEVVYEKRQVGFSPFSCFTGLSPQGLYWSGV